MPAPGYYDAAVSTRAFDGPLFGSEGSTTYRFFGSQSFPGAGDYRIWMSGGFPDYATHFGIGGESIPAGRFVLGFDAGDFQLGSLRPESLSAHPADSYPLRGFDLTARGRGHSFRVFGGESLYGAGIPGGDRARSGLFGAEYLARASKNTFGAGVVVVRDPLFADPDRTDGSAFVVSGRYLREISPWAQLFAEGMSADGKSVGGRLGAHVRMLSGEFSASLYSFDEEFPYVYPLFRPGERGLDLRGRFDVTEFVTLDGSVYYATDDAIFERDELRGSAGVTLNFGSDRPSISVDYSHDDLVYRTLDPQERGVLADRLAVTISKSASRGYIGVTVEHSSQARNSDLDRSQGLLIYRRALGARSFLDGSAVVQRDEDSNLGFTADAALERPLAGRFYYRVGLGAVYLDRGEASGEGVARLGISRRLRGSGWYARVETRLPFSVGLVRSGFDHQVLALDVGNRFDWQDLRSPGSAIPGKGSRRATGTIEGTVLVEGAGHAGLRVLVDGEPRATTRRDGSFVVHGVPEGAAWISVDLRALDPGLEVAGEGGRQVHVTAGMASQLDFAVARFSSFQGALVRCDGAKLEPLKAAGVTLYRPGFSRTAHTSVVGGFQFDRVPPGLYELSLAPDVGGETFPTLRVDLHEEIFGYVLEVGCPDSPGDPHPRITPILEGP